MPELLLTKEDIKNLLKMLLDIFNTIKNVKERYPLARYIQFPKIPSILSQSIAVYLLREGKILPGIKEKAASIDRGGKSGNIIVMGGPDEATRIEVKATGKSAFEYFYQKDIDAQYLIWLHFGDFFISNEKSSKIQVYLLQNPSKYFTEPRKITLQQFIQTTKGAPELFECNLEDFLT